MIDCLPAGVCSGGWDGSGETGTTTTAAAAHCGGHTRPPVETHARGQSTCTSISKTNGQHSYQTSVLTSVVTVTFVPPFTPG